MKAINVINPGKNSQLRVEEISKPVPGKFEVRVKITAAAINRADLLQRRGNYPAPEGASPIPGLEMAGIVEDTGSEVTRWEPGDHVFGLLAGGGYAEFCVTHEALLMPIPDNLSFVQAAAIPETFYTAYQALSWVGEFSEGETLLVHAAGSGVGTSAIQLGRALFNARILATAGKDHKLKTARELGAGYTYNYNELDFAEGIARDLGPECVDLVLDFVGAPYWNSNIEILAEDGRMVLLAMLGGHRLEAPSLVPILKKRLTVRGSTLRSRSAEYKIRLTGEFTDRVLPLFSSGTVAPVIDSEYDWQNAEQAHRRMAENLNTGKIVLTGISTST